MSSSVFSWGSDVYGRLGHGTEDKHLQSPTEIKSLSGVAFKQVTCGSAHNIAIDSNGTCYTWGKCHYGQLGHGEQDRDEHSPRVVDALKGISVASVTGGDSHVLAITEQGSVYSWGLGYYGTLGHGDETSLALPRLIESLSEVFVSHGTSGANHNLVVTASGSVYVWGRDNYGQLDLPTKTISISPGVEKTVRMTQKIPVLKTLAGPVKMLNACFNHTLILLTDGRIISFGYNEHGELGRHTNDEPLINSDHFKEPVIYVTAGWKHCAAITKSGQLYTWGHGSYGRLGTGHCRDTSQPMLVKGLPSCTDVSCGESHTIAIDNTGRLWGWGSGHYGKLGLPLDDVSFIQTPQMLSFVSPMPLTGVSCGTNHSLTYCCTKIGEVRDF